MEYIEFLSSDKRRSNVMTRCTTPEIWERFKIDIGIYDLKSKRNHPRSVKQREICLYFQKTITVLSGKKREILLNGVEETEGNFKNVKNLINENNLKRRNRYRFPKLETKDQLENVFVFDLATHNGQEFADAYAAGLYDENCLRDPWNRDLTPDEKKIEKKNVTVFDGSNGNPVLNMLKFISENFDGVERTYIDEDGDEIVSSYTLLLVGHNSSGFDIRVVLNSLVKEITELKNIKSARELTSLSFRCSVKIVNTIEVPQYVKFTCTKAHTEGSEKNR